MARVLLGSVAAAIAMFLLSFIFHATPLERLSRGSLDDNQATVVQQTLARAGLKTGTYYVPSADTATQASLYARGPISTIHYNSRGYAPVDAGALAGGLVLFFLVALLIGAALIGIDRRVPDTRSRVRVAVILAVAGAAFCNLREPFFFHHPWGRFLYLFVADAAVLGVGAYIIARWFLPHAKAAEPSVEQV